MLQIRIISLQRAVERRQHVQEQLEPLGLNYRIIDAVDGKLLPKSEIEQIYDAVSAQSIRGKNLSSAEIGCALSHIRLYREIVDAGIDAMLIMEDDIVVNKSIVSALDNYHLFPDGWDMIFFGCDPRRAILKSIPCGKTFSDGFELKHARGTGPVTLTHAYAISNHGAAKLLNMTSSIHKPIDYYTGDIGALSIYVFTPAFVTQGAFPSLINSERVKQKAKDKLSIETEYLLSVSPWLKTFPSALQTLTELRLISGYKKLRLSIKYRAAKLRLTLMDYWKSMFHS